MTREVVNALPQAIRNVVENYRTQYKREDRFKAEIRHEMRGYVKALRDAKVLTERERQILYAYMTTVSERNTMSERELERILQQEEDERKVQEAIKKYLKMHNVNVEDHA